MHIYHMRGLTLDVMFCFVVQGELDDLTHEHAKLLEANKLTMEECERESEDKNKVNEHA